MIHTFDDRWFKDTTSWFILCFSLVLLLPTVIEPLGFDNALYQCLAVDITRGKVLYLQAFDQNFPGIIILQSLCVVIFGSSDLSFRFFDLILQTVFSVLLYRFLIRSLPRSTAALSSLMYILFYVAQGEGVYGQRDIYIVMCVVVAAVLIRSQSTVFRLITAGALMGFATMLRPTSILLTFCLSYYLVTDSNLRLVQSQIKRAVLFLGMSVIPMFVFALLLSREDGAMKVFIDGAIRFNLEVYGRLHTPSNITWEFIRASPLLALAFVGVLHYRPYRTRATPKEIVIYCSLAISFLLIVILQGKFFRYHLAAFFIMLIPLAAIGTESLTARITKPILRTYLIGIIMLFATMLRFNPTSTLAYSLALLEGFDPHTFTYEITRRDTLFGAEDENKVIKYLHHERSMPRLVEVCSFDPRLRLHLNFECAGKYPSLHNLALAKYVDKQGNRKFTNFQREWQRSYVDTIRQKNPDYIIIAHNDSFWSIPNLDRDLLRYLPGFDSLLTVRYHHDTTFGGWEILDNNTLK